ncbi:MAG: hypothetical protein IPP93_05445 [Chitinophagaceae bacterium]|nr:hypothetical protein [Chitinophagaceae bacterium]MBL0334764.1 hypothetical protein [Chitinophagaceae bacterium]
MLFRKLAMVIVAGFLVVSSWTAYQHTPDDARTWHLVSVWGSLIITAAIFLLTVYFEFFRPKRKRVG